MALYLIIFLSLKCRFVVVQLLSCVWLFGTPWAPRDCSNSCPQSWWCHSIISSSVIPFSSCLQSFPASGSFQWVSSLHRVAKVLELQLHSFQWIFRTDFLQDELVWSLCCPQDSQKSSPTPQFKSINSLVLSLLHSPTLTSIHNHRETIALTRGIFVAK